VGARWLPFESPENRCTVFGILRYKAGGGMPMDSFRAWRITKADGGQAVEAVRFPAAELMEGEVTVRVAFSTVNYKDGLAITGKLPVVRRWPMIPGIDFAGTVEASDSPEWKVGDAVVATGWGLGETHLGGYAEIARVKAGWLVPLPHGLEMSEAMAIGTAGFTALLAVMALERQGLKPDGGPIVVSGATGGVGSVAVALLARLGFTVHAVTGKAEQADYLKELGAAEVLARSELGGPVKPLAKERWAGGIDTVGGAPLANMLAATRAEGAVAACGNAAGLDLPGSVAPFILRGIALLGINSVYIPPARRREAWARLARDLDRALLARMTTTIGFDDIPAWAEKIVAGGVRGRVVVRIGE
jgi:acrylyl-CoA reductase (NADPH)